MDSVESTNLAENQNKSGANVGLQVNSSSVGEESGAYNIVDSVALVIFGERAACLIDSFAKRESYYEDTMREELVIVLIVTQGSNVDFVG